MRYIKELFCFTVIMALVIISVILPPSGKTALLDETCSVLEIWSAVIYILWKIAKRCKAERAKTISVKIARAVVTAVIVSAGILFSRPLAMDMFLGPKTIILYEPKVSNLQGHTGIFSLHYYLYGEDEDGTIHRIEISGDEYQTIQRQSRHEMTVRYYEHTKRLFQYW